MKEYTRIFLIAQNWKLSKCLWTVYLYSGHCTAMRMNECSTPTRRVNPTAITVSGRRQKQSPTTLNQYVRQVKPTYRVKVRRLVPLEGQEWLKGANCTLFLFWYGPLLFHSIQDWQVWFQYHKIPVTVILPVENICNVARRDFIR